MTIDKASYKNFLQKNAYAKKCAVKLPQQVHIPQIHMNAISVSSLSESKLLYDDYAKYVSSFSDAVQKQRVKAKETFDVSKDSFIKHANQLLQDVKYDHNNEIKPSKMLSNIEQAEKNSYEDLSCVLPISTKDGFVTLNVMNQSMHLQPYHRIDVICDEKSVYKLVVKGREGEEVLSLDLNSINLYGDEAKLTEFGSLVQWAQNNKTVDEKIHNDICLLKSGCDNITGVMNTAHQKCINFVMTNKDSWMCMQDTAMPSIICVRRGKEALNNIVSIPMPQWKEDQTEWIEDLNKTLAAHGAKIEKDEKTGKTIITTENFGLLLDDPEKRFTKTMRWNTCADALYFEIKLAPLTVDSFSVINIDQEYLAQQVPFDLWTRQCIGKLMCSEINYSIPREFANFNQKLYADCLSHQEQQKKELDTKREHCLNDLMQKITQESILNIDLLKMKNLQDMMIKNMLQNMN